MARIGFMGADGRLFKPSEEYKKIEKKKKEEAPAMAAVGQNKPTQTVKVNQTVEPTVKTTVNNTINEEGYTKTNKKYGDYYNDDESKNNLDIYKKDNKLYYKGNDGKYNEIVHTTGQSLQPVPTQVKETKKEKTNATINFDNKKELKYQPKEKEEEKLSPINQIKLDTEDLTKEEKKKYKKSLLQQEEQEREKSNFVRRSGTGIDALTGAYGNVFENPNNPIQKEIAKPLENAERIYESGKLNNKLALEWYKKAQGKSNNVEEIEKEIQKFNNFNQDIASGNVGWLGESIQNANTQVESLKNQGIAATGGAILGGGLGALVGLKTGDVAGGALKGSKLGAKAGYTFGSTPYTYKLEYGNSYKDMKELGVSDKKAKNVATAVASINSAIESGENIADLLSFSGAGKLASSEVKGQAANKMADDFKDIIEDLGEEKAKSYIEKKFGPEVAEQVFKTYTKNAASESLEEGSQELTSILGERYATKSEGINRGISVKEDAERVGKSALAGGSSALVFGIPTSLVGNATSYVLGKTQNAINNMKQQNNINTQDSINTQQKVKTKPTIEENNQIKAQQLNQIEQDVKTGTITPEQGQVALQQVQTRVEPQTIETKPVENTIETPRLTQQEQQELNNLQNFPFELDEQQERRMDELLLKQNKDLEKNMSPVRALSDVRDFQEVGNKKVNAYQYDNPEVKPYFQEVAKDMLYDLDNSTKGERYMTEDGQFKGIKRNVPSDIAELLDGENGVKYSYKEIEDGLNAIIKDNGAENKAVAKRLEFYIDQRLRNGYMDSIVGKIPANNEYIETLRNKNAGENPNIPVETSKLNQQQVESSVERNATNQQGKSNQNDLMKEIRQEVEDKTNKTMSKHIETSSKATNTVEDVRNMNPNDIVYNEQTHSQSKEKALKELEGKDIDTNVNDIHAKFRGTERLTNVDSAKITELMKQTKSLANEAIKNGNDAEYNKRMEQFRTLKGDYAVALSESGQFNEYAKVIKELDPETQIDVLEKFLKREQRRGNKKYENVKLNEDLVEEYKNAKTDEERDEIIDKIYDDTAKQIKITFADKANEFRFLSMLGNLKTHGRNIIGNAGMYYLQSFKDGVAAIAEDVYNKVSKNGLDVRTKTLKPATKEVSNFVNNTVDSFMKDETNKYNENKGLKGDLEGRTQKFSDKNIIGKALNKLSYLNKKALDWEDKYFSSKMTKQAMKGFLTANGIETNADIEAHPELVAQALDYAIFKGKEATFHQDSTTATAIRNFRDKLYTGSGFSQLGGLAVDTALPFVSTPANIGKNALEYTPIIGFGDINKQFQNAPKNMKANVVIDSLSKQFSGAALMAVGAFLASKGWVKGSGDDDKEDKTEASLGNASYSIKIGNSTYDLSWLSPTAIPFFEGVEVFNAFKKAKSKSGLKATDTADLIDTMFGTLNPMIDMSVLQSVERIITSIAYGGNAVKSATSTTFSSYLQQYIPTLLSQFAQTVDTKQRNTNTGGNVIEKTWDQIKYKIPGARNTLPEKTDVWGNTNKTADNLGQRMIEAFLSPANRKDYKVDKTTKELERLAKETDDTTVLPTIKNKSLTVNGKDYNLKGKDYANLQKTYGQTAKKNLDELTKSDAYKNASDTEKRGMVGKIYDYASYKAKEEYAKNKGINFDSGDQTAFAMVDAFDIPYESYVEHKVSGNESASKMLKKLNAAGLSEAQKGAVMNYFDRAYYVNEDELYDTLENSNLSEKQKELVREKYENNITDSERERYQRANNIGVDYDLYTNFRNFVTTARGESKTGGLSKKQKVINWIQDQKLTAQQKYSLYNDYTNNKATIEIYK